MLNKCSICACLYSFLTPAVFAESVYSQIDERLLFDPDPVQVKQEAAGKVIIYDRVREQIINEALDNNLSALNI